MPDDIAAIIETIVETAQIRSRRRRDELRRELRSHFEECGGTPEALQVAVARFGDTAGVGDALRQVYRRDYVLFYVVKVGVCLAVATMAAMVIEACASLRIETAAAWHLSPGFAHAAPFGIVLTLALVAAAEATRAPFTWSRALVSVGCYAMVSACALSVNPHSLPAFMTASILAAIGIGSARAAAAWTARALLTLEGFAVAEYVWHQSLGIRFGPLRALEASAILLLLWTSTVAIVACGDRAFVRVFKTI